MSRGINEQDVWKAADALLLEGARPTIERVRLKIGRGSPNTVSPHLESWFARLGARKVPTRELPDWLVKLVAMFDPTVRQIVPDLG